MIPEGLRHLVGRDGLPLERLRLALVALERERPGGWTIAQARAAAAPMDMGVCAAVVKAFRQGALPPLAEPWDRTAQLEPVAPKATPPRKAEEVAKDLAKEREEDEADTRLRAQLGAQVTAARTPAQVEELLRRVGAELVQQHLAPREADAFREILQRVLLAQEQARRLLDEALPAIDVLTPDEVEVLAAYRRSRVPAPLAPGEAAPPP